MTAQILAIGACSFATPGGPVSGDTPYDAQPILADDHEHVFHSWAAQSLIDPIAIVGGEGAWFWDLDGNRYLDFASQLVYANLGHQHPRMVAALREQAEHLCLAAPDFAVGVRSEAARMIAERAPAGLNKVFFTNGGTEATENAIRMARLHTGRHKVLAGTAPITEQRLARSPPPGSRADGGASPGYQGLCTSSAPISTAPRSTRRPLLRSASLRLPILAT